MLSELEPGQWTERVVLAGGLRPGTTRHGKTFFNLTVQDRSAKLAAKVWDPDEICPDGIEESTPYRIKARVETFRDELQLNIQALERANPSPEELHDLVMSSRWSIEELETGIRTHLDEHLQHPLIRRIVDSFLDDASIGPRYFSVPAASMHHHAYRGGLAEHTLSMLRVATALHAHYDAYYPGLLQKDLLLAGVILHDMGKVWEFTDELVPSYSTAGRLVGHIPMMSARIEAVAHSIGDIPRELVLELQHLVLSHHGRLEYGSPIVPKTAEAQLLHYIDNIDARMAMFHDAGPDPGWTSWHRALERQVFVPDESRAAWLDAPLPPQESTEACTPPADTGATKANRTTGESADARGYSLPLFHDKGED